MSHQHKRGTCPMNTARQTHIFFLFCPKKKQKKAYRALERRVLFCFAFFFFVFTGDPTLERWMPSSQGSLPGFQWRAWYRGSKWIFYLSPTACFRNWFLDYGGDWDGCFPPVFSLSSGEFFLVRRFLAWTSVPAFASDFRALDCP